MHETKLVTRILPVHIIHPREEEEVAVNVGDEFESLIRTLGAKIVDRVIQKIDRPHYATYIGRGKLDQIIELIKSANVDVVALDAMLKPGQLHAIQSVLSQANPSIEVWDRVDLILRIFEKHAVSLESKLQIELARMNYMGPRIYGMGYVLSRQGGGIGVSGIGETNTELMRRHWRDQKKKITDELKKISNSHQQQLDKRRRAGFKTVSIVGYTNAGKSTLFNVLSKKTKLEKDELFATLESSVGKMYVPALFQEILITDTIGFIRNLPPLLISAFKSTLMESINADLILHIIDASDPEMSRKIEIVSEILHDLGVTDSNIVYVFNKIDQAPHINRERIENQYKEFSPMFISAREKVGIDEIPACIGEKLLEKNKI